VKQDPLALAVFGVALALLAGLLFYMFFFRAPEPPPAAETTAFLEKARRQAAAVAERFQEKPETKAPLAPVARPAPTGAPARSAANTRIEAGHTWRYAVVVDPPIWRDITLTYRTRRESAGIGVLTDFVHAGGKSNFHLGIFAPGDPTHANTRFPGFFMYAAYLKQPLRVGDEVSFGWHWQGKSAASMKRFAGQVRSLEEVAVPAGTYRAAVIEGTWSYLENGEFRARAREKFWFAPGVSQIVKIKRSGVAPDEGSKQIDAELADYR
jgi:hypothetical protein